MILGLHPLKNEAGKRENSVGMKIARAFLLVLSAMLFPVHGESQETPRTAAGEQSGFSVELNIDPVRKPVTLSSEALRVLATDKHISSCLDSQSLPREKLPANWFAASLIHLGGPNEIDLIVLPSGRLPETPKGEISATPA